MVDSRQLDRDEWKVTRMIDEADGTLRIYSEGDFHRLFVWEVQRATRYQDFLSLCLLRPDHSGSETVSLLDAVARHIVALLRSTDVVGVVDDTVAVLLVHTPDSDAALIMERLRGRVESHAFPPVPGQPELMPTLSLGLAEFPTDATSDESLLAQARARLGEARQARRRAPGAS